MPSSDEASDDNVRESGKPFSVRLTDVQRDHLTKLRDEAAHGGHLPRGWDYRERRAGPGGGAMSLGGFVVWAAMQWAPPAAATKKKGARRAGR
jgi:hypothetical protein